jgi:3-oxoacyl-[acyl-carrier-protein] synthase-1/3-oxoacyl-[acyl-carrier-protein] synthase II
MSRIVAFASSALSGLGRGLAAASAGAAGEPAAIATRADDELGAAGLARPWAARVAGLDAGGDRATELLERALGDLFVELDAIAPGWRGRRVGLALGTSSGGMRTAEELFRVLHRGETPSAELARRAQYFSPLDDVLAKVELRFRPLSLVLTACAASTIALGLAQAWLRAGECDVALAGGFDGVSVFVASGFEALRATTAALPSRPFTKARDGMALGEGAALIALAREPDATALVGARASFVALDGFGASGDAVHVTAPDRTGDGLARAALAALADAPRGGVALVSAHGTATPFNDAAEAKAMARALGDGVHPVVHPYKAQIGHTLGAAGALESLVVLDAIRRELAPASVVGGEPDPDAPAVLLERSAPREIASALKLSAAFGGANAALLWSRVDRPSPRAPLGPTRRAYASRAVAVDAIPTASELALRIGQPAEKLARADAPCFAALGALAELAARGHVLAGAGIVVGHAFATLDVNEQYNRRILERSARLVEPRRFPYTSPNAVCGECSLAFKLTGPNVAVGAGLHGAVEAVAAARTLVAGGHAERIVVVAVDAPERAAIASAAAAGWPLPKPGAVALLVSAEPEGEGARPILEAWIEGGGDAPAGTEVARGHEALLPLVAGASHIDVTTPRGGRGRIVLG